VRKKGNMMKGKEPDFELGIRKTFDETNSTGWRKLSKRAPQKSGKKRTSYVILREGEEKIYRVRPYIRTTRFRSPRGSKIKTNKRDLGRRKGVETAQEECQVTLSPT